MDGPPRLPPRGIRKPQPKKRFEFKFKFNLWTIILIIFLVLFFLPLFLSIYEIGKEDRKVDISQALLDLKEGKVESVEVQNEKLTLTYKDESIKLSTKEESETFAELLEKAEINPTSVNYTVVDQTIAKAFGEILSIVLPLGLMAVLFFFIIRSQSRGAQDIFSFGRSRAKLFAKGKQPVTFEDVAGVEDAKNELEEVVDFLKNPAKYRKIGARTPKGVILFGPAGVGKTLLARAVAGQAGVPFFSMAGSEFMEMLVGVGASRTRDLFAQAKASAPSIIFIDEIDAIGRQRGRGFIGGHDEREQTLNQILVEMDGFTPNDNVVVVAASVTGDTPVVIRQNKEVELLSIGEFVDQFYSEEEEGEVELSDVECLGFERKISKGNLTHKNLYFGNSAFKRVSSVFRHRVEEIYEIEYLGGKIRATGNHSVFVRDKFGIKTKAVSELKQGDVLVDLPFKVNRTDKELREVRAHKFNKEWSLTIPLLDPEEKQRWEMKYQFALAATLEGYSQEQIGRQLEVSQGSVGNWLSGKHAPRALSQKYVKTVSFEDLPQRVKVTPELCRLLGYYVAEGYSRWELDFCFNSNEKKLIKDVIDLMQDIFGITPKVRNVTTGAVNMVYTSAPVAKFFARLCGKGAHNKHVPAFLFEAPYDYFKEFLKGVWLGDGYEDKHGRGEITTVSKRLALELNWIARMHAVKTYIGGFTAKEGRRINNGEPLKAVRAWRVGWGKAANPFNKYSLKKTFPSKRAVVKKVNKLPFNGFVYDLCGVENEAFFGGESPVLLHNTNRGDLLDPALLRPGRFDRRVMLDMPDKEGREGILKIHARGKKIVKNINWDRVADRTVGFSGADLENMLNEAAIQAARADKKEIETDDIEEAATKVKLGPAKKRLQSEEDKKITAYHEAGHAIVTHNLPKMDPVHRISVVARGMSLGHTLIPPAADRTHETKSRILQQITAMLGGRAAEEIVFDEMTSGASNDIEQATRLARAMVVNFGMSSLGPIDLGPQMDYDELGRPAFYEPAQVSPAMQEKVDEQIKTIVDTAYKEAISLVKSNRKTLDKIVEALLKKETLDKDDFEKIVGKKTPEKK